MTVLGETQTDIIPNWRRAINAEATLLLIHNEAILIRIRSTVNSIVPFQQFPSSEEPLFAYLFLNSSSRWRTEESHLNNCQENHDFLADFRIDVTTLLICNHLVFFIVPICPASSSVAVRTIFVATETTSNIPISCSSMVEMAYRMELEVETNFLPITSRVVTICFLRLL